jgi:hypothetical protein
MTMTTTRRFLHAVLAAALLAALPAQAAVSKVMTYSGILKTAAGVPVTASTNITFRLYTTSSGGTAVWNDSVAVTPGADGWFSAALGIVNPLVPANLGQDLYLSLQVGTDAEFTQRARVTPSGSALAVDWSGVQGKPTCATGQFLTLDTTTGNLVCLAPTGGTGGLTSVATAAPLAGTGVSGAPVTLTPCPNGQILQSSGSAWSCIATPTGGAGGTGTVTSVSVAALTPITVATGTTTPVLSMLAAGTSTNGYLSAIDWNAFNAKAPTANPVFSGTVSASTVSATTFVGSLSGNASTATSATTATTATTALTANSVIPNVITPSDLITVTAPSAGQVPARGEGASADTFTWVTPLTAPAAATCAPGQVLTWNGSATSCVTDANNTYTAGAGLLLSGTQFAPAFTTSGGRAGVATTVARGDHTHAEVTTIPMTDFSIWAGAPTFGRTVMSSAVHLPGWTFAANDCIMGVARVPVGTGGSTGIPPTIKATVSTSAAITGGIQFANSGLVAGAAMPTCHWGAPGSMSTTLTPGVLTDVSNVGLAVGGFQVCGGTAYAGAGDLLLVRICGVQGMQLFNVTLTWN